MDEENFYIPRTLDDPKLFLVWELDCAMIAMIAFFVSLAAGFFFAVAVSYFATSGYVRLKQEGGRGLIQKMYYWFFPCELTQLGKTIPSHIRELIK